jgi:DNA-binding XRE family transcriptional regulator
MNTKDNSLTSLDGFIEENYGKRGNLKREKFEAGYENFKLGFLVQQARLEKGMTQEELAQKAGMTKSYISKLENNVKEARLSTLSKIVELGFGGSLEVSIKV